MEQFSAAEGAVAHIDPGVDEIGNPMPSLVADPGEPPRSAPPSHDPSASDGFTSPTPELETGKIAAMKRKLSDKGLDIEAAQAAVIAPQAAGAVAASGQSAPKNSRSKNGGISAQPAATESSPSSVSAASDVQVEENEASTGRPDQVEVSQSSDGAVSSRGSWQGPSHNFEADFEKGKIVSIKKELVAKGLHIDPAVAAALAAAGVTTASGNGSDGGLDAAIAAEFEKGKIAAMKERLVSEGLDIHAAAAAAAAALAKDAPELGDDQEGVEIAEADPGMASADVVEGAPPEAEIEMNRLNDTVSETTEPQGPTSAHALGEPVEEVGDTADGKTDAGPNVVIPAEGELEGEPEGDRTAGVSQGADVSAGTGMNGGEEATPTAAAASAAMTCEEGGGAPASAPPHEAISGDSNHIDHLLPPESSAYGAEESAAVPAAEGSAQNEPNANGKGTSADAGANGQAPPAVRAASSSTAPSPRTECAEANGEAAKGAPSGAEPAGATTKSKVRAAPSEGATSRAAKVQPRQQSTSPSRDPTTSDRKPASKPSSAPRTAAPSRRGSASPAPDRKRSSGTAGARGVARSSTSPAGVRRGTAPQQSSSRQATRPPQHVSRVAPQPSEPAGRQVSEGVQHPAVASPEPAASAQQPFRPARQPSRSPSQQPSHPSQARVAASLAEARSRRLAGSPAMSSGGDARRRTDSASITPSGARSRSLHSTPDEQRGTHGAARTSHPASGATTPSPSGPRVAGRGRAVERQVRSRYSPVIGGSQGASPAGTPSQESTVTPVRAVHGGGSSIVMTPYSAEQSGRRLHDRARLSRERLERRRREETSPVAPEVLSPFMPRRLANPNMGNPSVSGMERVERLYRDASQRESKLEMVRRMEDENPPDCTFTPKISARAASRGRSPRRGPRSGGEDSDRDTPGGEGDGQTRGRSLTCFHELYRDAEIRRAKMEVMTNKRRAEVAGPGSPVITARGRSRSREPLEVRLKENYDRWTRRWKELEERKVTQDREGCTFQPQLKAGRSASAPRMRTRGRENGSSDNESGADGEPFYLRVRKYIAAREVKLDQLKRDVESKQRAEATFQPNVSPGLRGDGDADDAPASAERAERGHRRRNNSGGGDGVFERLARAAAEQESNREALKQAYLLEERERFHGFQPRLPARSTEPGPVAPFEARLRESTAHWVQSREDRERRRAQIEAEQCTFRPSIGGSAASSAGSDGGSVGSRRSRRSSSADARTRSNATHGGEGPGRHESQASFEARSRAFQEAREKRLNRLREEKSRQELSEATFHPTIGFGNSLRSSNGGSMRGSGEVGSAREVGPGASMNARGAEMEVEVEEEEYAERPDGRSVGAAAPMVEAGVSSAAPASMSAAQRKERRFKSSSDSVNFKPQGGSRASPPPPTSGAADGKAPRELSAVGQAKVEDNGEAGYEAAAVAPAQAQGLGSPQPPPTPPSTRQPSAQPDHRPIATFKADAPSPDGDGRVTNLREALNQARRKRELQLEEAAAAGGEASASPLVSRAKAPVTAEAVAESVGDVDEAGEIKEVVAAVDVTRETVSQGVDVSELSARLQELADNSFSAEDAIDSPLGADNQDSQQAVAWPSMGVLVPTPAEAEEAPREEPSAEPVDDVQPSAASATQGAPADDEDVEARQELEAIASKRRVARRIAFSNDPQRASPGAEDSEAESAADADGGAPETQGESEAKSQGDDGGMEAESDEDEEVEELDAGRYQPYMPESDEGEGDDHDVHDVHAYSDYHDEHDDDDDESYGYGHDMYHDGPKTDQPSRSMADFDRCQREIEAKLRAL